MATIGFIGGTGPEGLGLAMRLALAGDRVLIGSRRPERAAAAAQQIRDALAAVGHTAVSGGGVNRDVVREADIIVVVVPFDGHEVTLNDLRGEIGSKIVVDAAVPLEFVNGQPGIGAVEQGSATEQAQALLPDARVIGAFHNLSARKLQALAAEMAGDVLITGDDDEAKQIVIEMVKRMPRLRPVDAGPLAMSSFVEGLTALILSVNRRYKTQAAVQMVGIE